MYFLFQKDSLGHGCIFQRSVFLYLIQVHHLCVCFLILNAGTSFSIQYITIKLCVYFLWFSIFCLLILDPCKKSLAKTQTQLNLVNIPFMVPVLCSIYVSWKQQHLSYEHIFLFLLFCPTLTSDLISHTYGVV